LDQPGVKLLGGFNMAWKTPKVLEISIGMEINSYACAEI
jgi:coenzyme PQQ precursor peptide PqqA